MLNEHGAAASSPQPVEEIINFIVEAFLALGLPDQSLVEAFVRDKVTEHFNRHPNLVQRDPTKIEVIREWTRQLRIKAQYRLDNPQGQSSAV